MTRNNKSKMTPPQIAEAWGVSPEKIIGFIRSGELKAINVATRRRGRPRYLVDIEDLEAFERLRTVCPRLRLRRPRRAKVAADYF
jgi:hypothetical protein